MAKRRTFSVTIDMVDGAGAQLQFSGAQAESFNARFQAFVRGDSDERGFNYKDSNGTVTTVLYRNIKSVVRSEITATDTTDFAKSDLIICA